MRKDYQMRRSSAIARLGTAWPVPRTAGIANVNFTRKRMTRTISGGVYLAGHGYRSETNGDLWVGDGIQSVLVTNGIFNLTWPAASAAHNTIEAD
jgi:hypothetical protein